MKNEIWKPVNDYEGIYEVSNGGRIRTVKDKITHSKRGERHWKQRVLKHKGETYKTGYRVSLWKDGKSKDFLVARIVATAFLGKSNLTVNHIDGNRFNNNVENLEWVSLTDNIRKGFEIGLYPTKRTVIYDKNKKEYITFISLSGACRYMRRSHTYITQRIKKGLYEDKDYYWQVQGGK